MAEKSVFSAVIIKKGDPVSHACDNGGFYHYKAPYDGILLPVNASLSVYLSKKNLQLMLDRCVHGKKGTILQIEEFPKEKK